MHVTQPFSRAFAVCLARLLRWAVLATLVLFTAPQTRAAHAATRVVTNTNDSGAGSLRQAVLDAASGDTITFSPAVFSVPATITLSSRIDISRSLTIDGAGVHTPTISGNNVARVFYTHGIAGNVALKHLRIVNGNTSTEGGPGGSGLFNGAILKISNSEFSGNNSNFDAGAISNGWKLDIENVTFTQNSSTVGGSTGSGAITNYSEMTMTNVIFDHNTAPVAGALRNHGRLIMTNAIFTANGGGRLYTTMTLSEQLVSPLTTTLVVALSATKALTGTLTESC